MASVSVSGSANMHQDRNDDNNHIPFIGMVFDNFEEAYQCYNNYGGDVGFSIKIQSYSKSKDGMVTSKLFVSSKEGTRKPDKRDRFTKSPRVETRTGCGALMAIKLNKTTGKYVVYRFVSEHNHEVVRPDLSQPRISIAQGEQIELIDKSGIALRQSYELMGKEVDESDYVGLLGVDQKNYLRTKRQRCLKYGELGIILKYFQDKIAENESLFHAFQLDSEEQITNILWADAQMIIDYGHFGDAISFDTTYKMHKDSRPFATFLGFNHHREVIIFGAALMYDETAESFTWLFETFLRAMSNKHPKTILTYQNPAIAKALKQVMPNTFHRLCKWHIMQNALKHIHEFFEGPDVVKKVFGRFFDEPDEEDEWLAAWDAMLDEFNVRENTWLKMMFELREKWTRPYVRRHWSARIQSTQLSESTIASLNCLLRSDYGFSQFFTHFQSLLEEKREKERDAEKSLSYRLPKHGLLSTMWLQHAGTIYTKKVLEELYVEFVKSIDVYIEERGEEGACQYFIISPPPDCNRCHRVTKGENGMLSCNCMLFDMQGILCCHMIKVLKEVLHHMETPDDYILKRWTRAARSENVSDMFARIVESDPRKERTSRFKTLNSVLRKISYRGCKTDETYKIILKESAKLLNSIEGVLRNVQHSDLSHDEEIGSTNVDSDEQDDRAKGVAKRATTGPHGRQRVMSSSFDRTQRFANTHGNQAFNLSSDNFDPAFYL